MMKLDWLLLRIVICSCVKQVDFLIFFFFLFSDILKPPNASGIKLRSKGLIYFPLVLLLAVSWNVWTPLHSQY